MTGSFSWWMIGGQGMNAQMTDWTPEQQLALMLDLFGAQMDAALQDADRAVGQLTNAFENLVMPLGTAALPAAPKTARLHARHVQDTVTALQFYDRLSQRLTKVRHSLSTLAMFTCDPGVSRQRAPWTRLCTSLRRLYSSAEERAVFELMMEGASPEDACEQLARQQAVARRPPMSNCSDKPKGASRKAARNT